MTRGKAPRLCTVVDVWKTYNDKGEMVRLRYVSTHEFCGQTVTDYDVWAEKPVTAKEVIETLHNNVENTKRLLTSIPDAIPEHRGCSCAKALEEAQF